MAMTAKELKLAAALLSMAADEFGYHCSNDMDMELVKDFTPEERIAMAAAFDKWNGDPESERKFEWIGDSSWMSYLAAMLARLHDDRAKF